VVEAHRAGPLTLAAYRFPERKLSPAESFLEQLAFSSQLSAPYSLKPNPSTCTNRLKAEG